MSARTRSRTSANRKVLVPERRHLVGGASVAEEVSPGFKVSIAADVLSLFRPELIRDLRLGDYGLRILERNPSSLTPFPATISAPLFSPLSYPCAKPVRTIRLMTGNASIGCSYVRRTAY